MKRLPRGWRIALEVVLFVVLIVGVRLYMTRGVATGPAPAIHATTLASTQVALGNGPVVLVHFWATWCPICRAEQGSIAAIARDYPVIAIAMQSGSDAEVQRYVTEQRWAVPVVNDVDGRLTQAYGVRGVPASFVVDGKGQIRAVEVGYTTEIGLRLRLWWAAH